MIEPSKCRAENENSSQENNSLFARHSRHAAWIMLVVCLVIVATATMYFTAEFTKAWLIMSTGKRETSPAFRVKHANGELFLYSLPAA